jgi:hypothetical protein
LFHIIKEKQSCLFKIKGIYMANGDSKWWFQYIWQRIMHIFCYRFFCYLFFL